MPVEIVNEMTQFQPTLPLRGATEHGDPDGLGDLFQPTLPLRGATFNSAINASGEDRFQPTLPLRGATYHPAVRLVVGDVSTHAPLAGSDWCPRNSQRSL